MHQISGQLAQQIEPMRQQHGDIVLEQFPTAAAALARIKSQGFSTWEYYGLRSNGVEWFQIRPLPPKPDRPAPAPRKSVAGGRVTATTHCLSVYRPGIDRDAFVAAATALGVKDSTARTMYSDIKSGRIK